MLLRSLSGPAVAAGEAAVAERLAKAERHATELEVALADAARAEAGVRAAAKAAALEAEDALKTVRFW